MEPKRMKMFTALATFYGRGYVMIEAENEEEAARKLETEDFCNEVIEEADTVEIFADTLEEDS